MDENDFPGPQQLGEMVTDTKMVQVANLILSQAVSDRATAIHLETYDDSMRVSDISCHRSISALNKVPSLTKSTLRGEP